MSNNNQNLDEMFSSLVEELQEEGSLRVDAHDSKSLSALIAELDDSKVQHLCSVHIASVVRKVVEGKLSVSDSERVTAIFKRFVSQLESVDISAARAARVKRVKSFTPFSSIKTEDL